MGTPAEEGGGGKVNLINHGAFQDVDFAMMVHPFPNNDIEPVIPGIERVRRASQKNTNKLFLIIAPYVTLKHLMMVYCELRKIN